MSKLQGLEPCGSDTPDRVDALHVLCLCKVEWVVGFSETSSLSVVEAMSLTMKVATMKVTTKTRFGYAYTNQPEQTPMGLIIPQPTVPQYKNLGWKQLKEVRQKAARLNSSNFWSETVFVDGKAVSGIHVHQVVADLISELELDGYAVVRLQEVP